MKNRGVIEIRLDKRQAFYAFVGCMLIVSVAFVVGIIVGERMDLPDPGAVLALSEGEGGTDPLLPADEDDQAEPEPHDYTFYDELSNERATPQVMFEPAAPAADVPEPDSPQVRELAREQRPPEPEPEQVAAVQPAPPVPEPDPPAPAPDPVLDTPTPEPVPEPVADRPVPEEERPTRSVSRRTVRRDQGQQGPEEFGYFVVEIGRFASFDEADARRITLAEGGHNAIVTLLGDDTRLRYRVQLGSFTRRSEAEATAVDVNGRVIQEG